MTRHSILTKLIAIITLTLTTITTAWAQTGNWDSYKASGYASGSGTQADPYIINTAEQLAYFAANVTSGKDASAYVELGDNIDLSGHWWLPIGNRSSNDPGNSFSGNFDGKGYTISNMTREWGSEENSGFFSFIKGGSVKNLIFTDAYLTNNSGNLGGSGARRVGVLAGATRNKPVIENIIVRDSKIDLKTTCTQQNAWDLIGGLVGGIYDSPTFANCYVDVDIDLTNINNYSANGLKQSWFALFLGAAESNSNPTIKNVFAVGTLKVDQQRNFTDISTILGHDGGKGKTIDNCYYVNTPTAADGSTLTSAISNGEVKTADFMNEFLKLANEYIGDHTDLQTWNWTNGVPTYNAVSMIKKIDKENRKTVLSVSAPENSDITWTIDQEGTNYEISSDKTSLSIPFNNKKDITGNVTINIKDESGTVTLTKTINFTAAILTYSDDLYAESYGGGTGTETDPYIISNDLELAKLAYDVNNASSTGAIFSGKYFKVTANIDLSSALWKPIGTTNYKSQRWFAGKLDGDGHTIKDMRMLWNGNSGTWVAYGLFAYLKGNAANEAGFSSVTNLVIDNASLEKAAGSTIQGNGTNIGTLVGETNANVEISNIIIRNSRITDNDETYTASGYDNNQPQFRFGGVIGNIGGDNVVRVYNIAADVDINVFKNADNGSVPVYLGGIMANCEATQKTDSYHIYPTNLYFLGDFDTKANSSYYFGTIMAKSNVVPTTEQQSTYFYANAINEKRSTTYGSQRNAQTYGFTFTNFCNTLIKDKGVANDHYYWKYSKNSNEFSFTKDYIEVSIKQTIDKTNKTVTLTLEGNILDYKPSTTWTVEGTDESSNELSITVPMKNIERNGSVTFSFTKDGEENESTLSTTISPLTYSIDLYADNYASGTGTKDDPYIISNDLELAKLARDVNNASSTGAIFNGTYFKIEKDIDLGAAIWNPVGTTNYINQRWFAGKLNGNGKTIKNMRICWDGYNGKWTSFGMFAYLRGNTASESGFCTVTNFILEDAKIEKVKGATVAGQGTNIALIVGEMSANVELSNIIIRNGIMTDNEESYTASFEFRYGSLIGNVNGKSVTRIFNISAGVEINALKNATTNGKTAYIAGLIGQNGTVAGSNSYHVFPTNIYVHKANITTNESANYHRGAIIASSTTNVSTTMQSTWYYADTFTGSNAVNYGTQKTLADFSSTFVQQNNQYIQNNKLDDLATWVYSDINGFDYGSTILTLNRGDFDVITAETEGVTGDDDVYYWYVSSNRKDWEQLKDDDNNIIVAKSVTLPSQEYDQYVYAVLKNGSSASKYLTVSALRANATLDSKSNPGTYYVRVTNTVTTDNSNITITYQWFESKNGQNTDIEGATSDSYSPAEDQKVGCHVTVHDKSGKLLLDKYVYTATVVYLCPARCTDSNGNTYEPGEDKNDDSWGYTPETAMKTWKGAYSKLEKGADWDENYIVLMGVSSADVTNDKEYGFNITTNYQGGSKYTTTYNKNDSPLFRNTTITSKWDNVSYNGEIFIGQSEWGLPIWGDTRFENIAFGYSSSNYNIMYCQYNNLEMGEGVVMSAGWYNSPDYGKIEGSASPSFQIFGGILNDARLYPLNNKDKFKQFEDAMPHGKDGFTMTFKSGFYSAICAGGRQTSYNLNGIMGTPDMPVKCTITMDIDRAFNDSHKTKSNNGSFADYDAAIILAGNHEGAMFGDVDIVIKSGIIGRVVSGTLGATQRKVSYTHDGKEQVMPFNTYMGRANILLDPASSEMNKTETDIDERIKIVELYGGSAGRGFSSPSTGYEMVNNPFYGYSTIHIKGGTFTLVKGDEKTITCGVFGAGAGGMNGIGNDTNHTKDTSIPYWGTENTLVFNSYDKDAKDKLVHYNCYNADTRTYTDVDPLKTNTSIIIDGGKFGTPDKKIDGIYAGGSGYMSTGLWTSYGNKPNTTGGNIYGEKDATVTSLTINGGAFYCTNGVFAGGRGTNYYYTTNAYAGTNADYTDLGQIYGNVELNINGGEFHCPVFGGGYGVADAKLKDTENISTLDGMARIYGKSTVNINGGTFYDNIYGGGDMAVVEYNNANDPATNIIIGNNADIRGSVFAGGNGRDANTTKSPEKVGRIIGSTSVAFTGDSKVAPYIYGDIYGGGNLAQVSGDTHVNIYAANFAGELFGGGKGLLNGDGTVNTSADVLGNTNVSLAKDQGGQEDEDDKLVDYFSINVIWDKMWDSKNQKLLTWDPESTDADAIAIGEQYFYNGKFLNPHNIYGGGNVACKVGTYDDNGIIVKDADGKATTGKTTVSVQKGMTPYSLLTTDEWKSSYNDNKNPHFYVFGGGKGANTKVGTTDVTVDVEGDYGVYNAEVDDETDQLSKGSTVDFGSDTNSRAARKAARATSRAKKTGALSSFDGVSTPLASTTDADADPEANDNIKPVFDNSMGIPNFTILGVLGGGFAGTVSDSTHVVIDGKTFVHRVYGGGFGDPDSNTDNITGQVGGNANVYVQGSHVYGDVFGGGAGVLRDNAATATTYSNSIARVIGTTKVVISDDATIHGKVYGGGDMANVGEETSTTDYTNKPESYSTLNQTNGNFIRYDAKNYRTLVHIVGGDIFGNVFAGGKGVKKDECAQYDQIGRINGNTILHVVNTASGVFDSYSYDSKGNNIPNIWNRIYGGCAYGTVDGNTLVHVEGGKLGLNIFGGGYGDVDIDDDKTDDSNAVTTPIETLEQVLGKKHDDAHTTYANVLGNTKVQIDGGTWIWNQLADVNGNITTWDAANAKNSKICEDETEFKQIVAAIQEAKSLDDITLPAAKEAIKKIRDDDDTKNFFDINTLTFVKNHNIFGGGNRACYVGTYNADGSLVENTGTATVELNHSPLADIEDLNQETVSLQDVTTLPGLCWYLAIHSTSHPQFSVFGAGYGANTKVGNVKVYARPGARLKNDGQSVYEYRYLNQTEDMQQYHAKEEQYYNDFLNLSREEKRLYYGSATGGNSDGTDNDDTTFRRYRASRLAWSSGVPGFTFMEIHGGGFSGYVTGDAYVETDCELMCRNLYGGGLGAKPYGAVDRDNTAYYDFGRISGNATVFIKSGIVSNNVYGGGAGVESFSNDYTNNKLTDFPEMARINGKTKVHIYGEKISEDRHLQRSMIFGSVYGGGDVANVGTTATDAKKFTHETYEQEGQHTAIVNIRGGNVFENVFAGGNGRTKDECDTYSNLGGIYGDACLIIDRPVEGMTYPYTTTADDGTHTFNTKDPFSEENMRHPADGTNDEIQPYLWNRVYGGCQNGTIHGNTIVAINDGRLASNAFGGGWGNINNETGSITSADITGNTNLIVTGGRMVLTSYWLPESRAWEQTTIVNGITYSPQYDHQTEKFKVYHNIYGGGNVACKVGETGKEGGNTYVTLTKGMLYEDTQVVPGTTPDNFFETDEWHEVYDKVGSPHFCVFGGGYGENTTILNDTHVNVAMARRGPITDFDIKEGEEYKHFLSAYSMMDIVGGGYSGVVNGDTYVEGDGGLFCRRVFGGGFFNTVNNTHVTIKAIDCHDIFGGGLMGDVLTSTNVTVGVDSSASSSSSSTSDSSSDDSTVDKPTGFTNKDIYVHGDIYGGNDVSGYVNMGMDLNGFYYEQSAKGGTNIDIKGGHIYGNVYGAGNGDYLYALDKKGNTKVTVNENYPLNDNDPNSEKLALVYTVPMRENMPSYKAASDAAKIVNINSWRPMTNRVKIKVKGESDADDAHRVIINGDIYGGGNSATVQKVQDVTRNDVNTTGDVTIDIGSHVRIGRIFMGCNGDALFTASEDNDFMNKFQKLNGDIYNYTKELNLADSIDWLKDPSNMGISTLYLPTKNEDRPTVYPHLIDLYFQPVETDIQGTLLWNGSETGTELEDCTIGTFCCGGNRGNMNVYPVAADNYISVIPLSNSNDGDTETPKIGNVVDYFFPAGLTITDKIVGGCNNANYDYKGTNHEGGYLLGLAKSDYPFIKLTVNCQFSPTENDDNTAYMGGNVYGGCYETGTVRGDVTIVLNSDMLKGKDVDKIKKSNELITSSSKYSTLNVYGAGYGQKSYVYGNTDIKMGEGSICDYPTITTTDATSDAAATQTFNASGTSANFVYGGGQQGNIIGVTNVEVFNGHVYKSVTGGSYSGTVWGSTHVKVGYPTYYTVNLHHSGRYHLKRADQHNLATANANTETIKENIHLITGDLITQSVFDEIDGIYNSATGTYDAIDADKKLNTGDDVSNDNYFFTKTESTPANGWGGINIVIGEAVYGGGYSLAHGTSASEEENTTVLKYTNQYNLDDAFTTNAEHIAELNGLPGGTTEGFGGNTTILIADRTTKPTASSTDGTTSDEDRDHITISRQDMKVANVAYGKDLLGYYYMKKETDAAGNTKTTYHYIYQAGKYYKGGIKPTDMVGDVVYEYDNEGGVFGDGHLSYAEGFRSADLTGYGFASSTIKSPKILNTFQRMDILRLTDNCFSLLGARDYATNANDMTPYSISRVGEIRMFANNIEYTTPEGGTTANTLAGHEDHRSRNYMGFANNIHYVGALYSNVAFDSQWYDRNGAPASHENKSTYKDVKQQYIDSHKHDTDFEERNDGTAKNMIGIASGYALKVQNAIENADGTETLYYGPIYGVIEMNLIDVREDEGGGYVYADNIHERNTDDTHEADFLETSGNFVFPYTKTEGRFVVDDCFPIGYDAEGINKDVHYWYVTGFNYHYTAHITGYTYDTRGDKMKSFNSDNKDGIVSLARLNAGQKVKIQSWKLYSAHEGEDADYTCDLENRNYDSSLNDDASAVYGGYRLFVGASESEKYNETSGFRAELAMKDGAKASDTEWNNGENNGNWKISNATIPDAETLQSADAKITFQLTDAVNNNPDDDLSYYTKHLSKPCKATLQLYAEALEEKSDGTTGQIESYIIASRLYTKEAENKYEEVTSGNLDANTTYYYRSGETDLYQEVTEFFTKIDGEENYTSTKKENVILGDKDNIFYCKIRRYFTYTIDLTIEYIKGPSITGNITIENCALPGEMIRIRKNNVKFDTDQAFTVNGYYWRIGKVEKDENGNLSFKGGAWSKDSKDPEYDTYNPSDTKGEGLFSGCYYDKTEDYLDIPAFYYMNGYGIQLGVTMNAPDLNDIFPVKMLQSDTLTVHNYHRMDPHKTDFNLHLYEAMDRAAKEKGFAEPRIYLADQRDLTAFVSFVDSIGQGQTKEDGTVIAENTDIRYGKHAQFIMQEDLTVATSTYDGSGIPEFRGTFHGNGHVLKGLKAGNCLVNKFTGNIYNFGLASGKISNNTADADGKIGNYHCCYEYLPTEKGSPIVYRMDGTAYTSYTKEDFRLGRVAYDLNEYYLRARYSLNSDDDKAALKYVYDYFANGDYQYAQRADSITGKSTGIVYLRTSMDSDLPNYEQAFTRHNQSHTIDKARAQNYTSATADAKESRTGDYLPLFNSNQQGREADQMNDFLFWGQSLQSTPDDYPSAIASHQVNQMTNGVYRTAGYYGDTTIDAFHYNAYERGSNHMGTYVHDATTTAIDFTCQNDLEKATGMTANGRIFYPPLNDNAYTFSDFVVKDGITKNLLVYTDANSADNDYTTEAYDVVENALKYDNGTRETVITGHHIVKGTAGTHGTAAFDTRYFHLVERDTKGKNSESNTCSNNNLCVPIPFNVTDHAWYIRKPLYYAEDTGGAWEGICLPFTVQKAEATINGEITHFYGTPTAVETEDPAKNIHTLHHEYWLRGLTSVNADEGSIPTATFLRPGAKGSDLFTPTDADGNEQVSTMKYHYANDFFVNTYEAMLYNKEHNPYYAEEHDYNDYLPLTADVPYIVRFPGNRYYEFDLSSQFYNNIIRRNMAAQNITFHAYGDDNANSKGAVTVPVTNLIASDDANGLFSHHGTFSATKVAQNSVYGMNSSGTAFDDASTITTVMPFRTFMTPKAKAVGMRKSTILIAEASNIDRIVPEIERENEEEQSSGDFLRVIPIGEHRVRIESSRAMTLNVVTATGQLYRILDVRPGSAVYSGFLPGIYLFDNVKVMVQK